MWELGLLGGWFKNKNKNQNPKSSVIMFLPLRWIQDPSPSVWLSGRCAQSSRWEAQMPATFLMSWPEPVVLSVVSSPALPLHKPLAFANSAGKCSNQHSFLLPCWAGCREQALWSTIGWGTQPRLRSLYPQQNPWLPPLPFRPTLSAWRHPSFFCPEGLSLSSVLHWLWDLGQATSSLWTSACSFKQTNKQQQK